MHDSRPRHSSGGRQRLAVRACIGLTRVPSLEGKEGIWRCCVVGGLVAQGTVVRNPALSRLEPSRAILTRLEDWAREREPWLRTSLHRQQDQEAYSSVLVPAKALYRVHKEGQYPRSNIEPRPPCPPRQGS
jgi:hypothetical protein